MIFDKGFSIKTFKERCLNQKHNGVECKHCSEHCPSEAIIIHESQVYLDKDACVGCGICFVSCPTEVFVSNQWDESTILKTIEENKWSNVQIFCDMHSKSYRTDNVDGAVKVPVCLAAVSPTALYEMGQKPEISLCLEHCADCVVNKKIDRLKYHLDLAMEWAAASGVPFNIHCLEHLGNTTVRRKHKALEAGLKVTSRRDLFLSIRGKGLQFIDNVRFPKGESLSILDNSNGESLPSWRKRLQECYPDNVPETVEAAYWPVIYIGDKCLNCGACSHFCPSGALFTKIEDQRCTHYFINGTCLDCRICELFCPQETISRNREEVRHPFRKKDIYHASAIHCQKCNQLTFDSTEHLCYWCEKEKQASEDLLQYCKNRFFVR